MKKEMNALFSALIILASAVPALSVENVTTTWGGDAEIVYDTGFMHMLMKHPDGGVSLFNRELIENDAPGFRENSEEGYDDAVWGKNRARKIMYLDDQRAFSAWLVLATRYKSGKYPLKCSVNGHESILSDWKSEDNIEWCRWSEFPAQWLRKGKNTIDLYCPEAESEDEGWNIMISRADKFEEGGGDPSNVGKTSYKSFDGGHSWKQSPFGPDGKIRAEYSVMLNLDRYVQTGWLASPVIDLWKGDSNDFIVPLREIKKLKLTIATEMLDGTHIDYYFRRGISPQPFSDEWGTYESVGNGTKLDFNTGGIDLNRRYIQFKAVLSTENPLKSPVIKSAHLTAELLERVPLHENIYVVEHNNPPIRYSSIEWEWEPWDRPELSKLRERENLDEATAGSRTQFDAQVKILDYVAKRWKHSSPWPEYPAPDALSILNRIEYAGSGGYCSQFNRTLEGLCVALGWQARQVFVVGHEVMEVWNDELGKWIFLDADYQNHYNYDTKTGMPLNVLELHNRYLDYYFPGEKLDWMHGEFDGKHIGSKWLGPKKNDPPPVKRGSLTHQEGTQLTAFICAAFVRMAPRNNWFEKPIPIPLIHGSSTKHPFNGYIHWYDERTPPKRNYSWYTDRPQDMWFDLNTVHIDATSGFGNDRLFLRFETYTPNFSHFEVNVDDTGWKKVSERWTWLLQSGRNTLRARAVTKLNTKGKPSWVVVNHADAPFGK